MREYGKVSPQFWTGQTGKALRGHVEAQVVAAYLMTSPHATMIGVYPLPMLYLIHETGLSAEGASKGLARCIEVGFCLYDEDAETVFVVEMAAHQVGEVLKAGDRRAGPIRSQYAAISSDTIKAAFFDRYGASFDLPPMPLRRGIKGASKPLAPAPVPSLGLGDARGKGAGKPECPEDVDAQTWADWLTLRGSKKAPVTETVLRQARAEAAKAGLTLTKFLEIWCARGSQGLQADWLKPHERGSAAPTSAAPTRKRRDFNAEAAEMAKRLGVPT